MEHDATARAVYDRIGASQFEPEDSFLLGLTFARAGNLDRAFDIWNKAIQSGPNNSEMLDHLARLAARLQRLDEAALAARKLQSQPGWEARGLLVFGEIQRLLKNPEGAVDAIKKGLEIDPSAKGLAAGPEHFRKMLARSWLDIGQPNRAIQTLLTEPGKPGPALTDPEARWLLSRASCKLVRSQTQRLPCTNRGLIGSKIPLYRSPARTPESLDAHRATPRKARHTNAVGTPALCTAVWRSSIYRSPTNRCPTRRAAQSATPLSVIEIASR